MSPVSLTPGIHGSPDPLLQEGGDPYDEGEEDSDYSVGGA
jgi:hypothetical protein